MSYAATPTAGTVVSYTGVSPVVAIAEISGVYDVSVSPGSKVELDTTALKDTAAKFIGGQPDYGELTISYYHDPADTGQATVLSHAGQTSNGTITITMTDGGAASLAYAGYLHGWAPAYPNKGINSCSVKFKISGAPTLTP